MKDYKNLLSAAYFEFRLLYYYLVLIMKMATIYKNYKTKNKIIEHKKYFGNKNLTLIQDFKN